jgi:CxxC-x17-CxxC domain-containing protein
MGRFLYKFILTLNLYIIEKSLFFFCVKNIEVKKSMRDFNKGGFKRDFGPREMHKATCSECGQECEVPFKPQEGRPIYCKECYSKKRRY